MRPLACISVGQEQRGSRAGTEAKLYHVRPIIMVLCLPTRLHVQKSPPPPHPQLPPRLDSSSWGPSVQECELKEGILHSRLRFSAW